MTNEWATYTIRLPEESAGHIQFGGQARRWAREAIDHLFTPEEVKQRFGALFGWDLKGAPGIRFINGQSAIRLLAVGTDAVDHLRMQGWTLRRALAEHLGQALPEDWKSGPAEIRERDKLQPFVIPKLLIEAGNGGGPGRAAFIQRVHAGTVEAAEIERAIEKRVRQGLIRHADFYGLDLDEDMVIKVASRDTARMITPKPHVSAAAVTNVRVDLPVYLKGYWAAGKFLSHGYGLIKPDRDRQ